MAEPQAQSAPQQPESEFPFAVTVSDVFDGPLDLLLELIRKQNIDIHDIPIAKITAQFLAYCERIKQLDVDVAAEFIYMAALLIHIKSKMLLPRDPDAPADQEDDPRAELVDRLLEHQKYKNAAQMLLQKQQIESVVASNPNLKEFRDDEGTEPEFAADVIDLARVFQQTLDRAANRPMLQVDEDAVTVGQMLDYVRRRLTLEERPVRLKKLLQNLNSRNALVCTFLALLEMVRLQAVLLRQDSVFSDIIIKRSPNFDAVVNEHLDARDDWR